MSGDGILADEPADARIVPALVFIVQACRLANRSARKPVIQSYTTIESSKSGRTETAVG